MVRSARSRVSTSSSNQGGVTTLLGANGAGKTTTLRALCGMVRATGEVTLNGERLLGRSTEDIARGSASLMCRKGAAPSRALRWRRIFSSARSAARSTAEIDQDIERCFTYFPRLKQRRKQQAGTLSGGEQQMLAISRALMLRPRLMLLDEPSFGLAPLVVREMFDILRRLNQEEKVSLLVVEQNAALALGLADKPIFSRRDRS